MSDKYSILISSGVCKGVLILEKPQLVKEPCDSPICSCQYNSRNNGFECSAPHLNKDYRQALALAREQAVEFEDQEAIWECLCKIAFPVPGATISFLRGIIDQRSEMEKTKVLFKDGFYPEVVVDADVMELPYRDAQTGEVLSTKHHGSYKVLRLKTKQ